MKGQITDSMKMVVAGRASVNRGDVTSAGAAAAALELSGVASKGDITPAKKGDATPLGLEDVSEAEYQPPTPIGKGGQAYFVHSAISKMSSVTCFIVNPIPEAAFTYFHLRKYFHFSAPYLSNPHTLPLHSANGALLACVCADSPNVWIFHGAPQTQRQGSALQVKPRLRHPRPPPRALLA